jgi:hypothetical protein
MLDERKDMFKISLILIVLFISISCSQDYKPQTISDVYGWHFYQICKSWLYTTNCDSIMYSDSQKLDMIHYILDNDKKSAIFKDNENWYDNKVDMVISIVNNKAVFMGFNGNRRTISEIHVGDTISEFDGMPITKDNYDSIARISSKQRASVPRGTSDTNRCISRYSTRAINPIPAVGHSPGRFMDVCNGDVAYDAL